MSMPRDPVLYTATPSHNLIPGAGSAVYYALHNSSLAAGIEGLPGPLTELGTPSGAKWDTPGMYTLPTANADCALNVRDDADDLFIDSQMSLYGMQVGQQYITAIEASYSADPNTNCTLWCYGRNTGTASFYALMINGAELPRLERRGGGASGSLQTTLDVQSGTFAAFRGQGIFALVMSLRPVSATAVDVEMRMGNGALSAYYTLTAADMTVTGGSTPPGVQGGISMADFGGLMLGGRGAAGGGADNLWGAGAGNTGAIGNFSARKFGTYSASRVADTLAVMLSRPRDFPRTLCSDYA